MVMKMVSNGSYIWIKLHSPPVILECFPNFLSDISTFKFYKVSSYCGLEVVIKPFIVKFVVFAWVILSLNHFYELDLSQLVFSKFLLQISRDA